MMHWLNFRKTCIAITLITAADVLLSCKKDDPYPAVNFEITLTDSENIILNTVGQSKVVQGLLIIHHHQDVYYALDPTCPYGGTTVEFVEAENLLRCPDDGSEFNLDGVVMKGPAETGIPKYKTFLIGTSNARILRINS